MFLLAYEYVFVLLSYFFIIFFFFFALPSVVFVWFNAQYTVSHQPVNITCNFEIRMQMIQFSIHNCQFDSLEALEVVEQMKRTKLNWNNMENNWIIEDTMDSIQDLQNYMRTLKKKKFQASIRDAGKSLNDENKTTQ